MCLREVAGPQKKQGALTAVLPLPEELETHQSPRTVRSDPPPGDARSLALGPAGSQSGCLSSFQEPCGLGFSLLSQESFSTDPFRFSFSSFAVIFWLERVNFCYPVCSSIDFVSIVYLSVVSLQITIFIFIFLWFTLTLSHPSLSYKDFHDIKPSLSCLLFPST